MDLFFEKDLEEESGLDLAGWLNNGNGFAVFRFLGCYVLHVSEYLL